MSKANILIVDDEPDIVEVLGDRLESWDYEVRTVNNARACYAAVAEQPPDLILMDIQMPEISGMEALVELKTHHPDIPVLMISASTARNAARESTDRGAAGFVLKPFEPEELRHKIEKILSGEP